MLVNRLRHSLALLPVLALGMPAVWADERAPAAGSPPRSYAARPIQVAAPVTVQHQEAKPLPVRPVPVQPTPVRPVPVQTVQLDSHGRYPFGQFRGGYRYPFSYPYYRYGGPRHYPYSFGVGPYGPYGSNYGGYSGNAYDPQVYGRPSPSGPSLPDAPPAPPSDDPAPSANVTPPANRDQQPRVPQSDPAAVEVVPDPRVPLRPGPTESPANGWRPSNFGFIPLGLIYGGAPSFGAYPFGTYNSVWFGQNPLSGGIGLYQPQGYGDPYGPPSGPGYYSPTYVPQYGSFGGGRNYGPTYPPVGGITASTASYEGW